MTHLAMIWAQALDRVIGQAGDMPWRLPEDLAHFKRLTMGAPVVMGRRTWESLPPRFRPLEGRRNIVVSRQVDFAAEGAEVAASAGDALRLVEAEPVTWITGGATLYGELLPTADRLEVTEINLAVEGDTHAPPIDDSWRLAAADPATGWHTSRTGLEYRFLTYLRP